jgi:Flp pilus assembly protein TadG
MVPDILGVLVVMRVLGDTMTFRKDDSGQILILTAMSMTVIFGFLALAIDVGIMFRAKRNLQNAVDAAATGAALDYMFNYSQSKARTAATSAVSANYAPGAIVKVNFAPNITTVYHNTGTYVEVIATQANSTFFMALFGKKSLTIAARAVAGIPPGPGDACVILLDPHASQSMNLQGSFDVSADSCGIIVDSDAPGDALYLGGSSGVLKAGYVAVVGGASGQLTDSSPAPVTGASPLLNPFPGVNGPPLSDCVSGNTNSASSYTSTSTFKTLNGVACFTSSNVTFNGTTQLPPGVALFENGATFNGTVTSGPGGTTVDNYAGTFTVSSGTTLQINAPTTAQSGDSGTSNAWMIPYEFAYLQPAANTNTVYLQTGNEYGYLTGFIYAPGAQLYLNDSGGDKSGGTSTGAIKYTTDIIVGTMYDKTASLTVSSLTSSNGSLSSLTRVSLVE